MLFYLPIALTALVRARRFTFVRSIKQLNWATYVVGLSIVGVELAMLMCLGGLVLIARP